MAKGNSWRPKDWDNPYYKSGDFGRGKQSWNEQPEFSTFEAGADAMLEALDSLCVIRVYKTASGGDTIEIKLPLSSGGITGGRLIFIPDEIP